MRRLFLLILFGVLAVDAVLAEACPPASEANTFITYTGESSGCTRFGWPRCRPGELIVFEAKAFGYSFDCDERSFRWNFGDGSALVERLQVAHLYGASGIYQVGLEVQSLTSTTVIRETIDVLGIIYECWPFISRRLVLQGVTIARGVRFEVICVKGHGDWIWDFGDGTTARGPERTRDHVYLRSGTYRVQLSSSDGSESYTNYAYVPPVKRRAARH